MDRALHADPGAPSTTESHVRADRVARFLPGAGWLSWALVTTSTLVLVAWTYLAVVHVDDRYRLDHVSGARIALARALDAGFLYPPLYDGTHVGGTRFMPLPIVLHGAMATLTGEYVASGKLLAYLAAMGLVVTVLVLLRRLGCPFPYALALAVLPLTTNTGLSGSLNLRADVLPLLLQILTIWLVLETASPGASVGAAGLAALAFVSKLSAVWAPAAIVVWLLARDRRRAVWFVAEYVALVGGLLIVFGVWSDSRLFDNVFGLAASGVTSARDILASPYRLVHLLVSDATTVWALAPLAGLAAWFSIAGRRTSLFVLSLTVALAVLLVVLLDVGTGWNQLIDVVVLTGIVIGELIGRTAKASHDNVRQGALLTPAIGLFLVWMLVTGFMVTLVPAVRTTADGTASYRADPLAGIATGRTRVLSEDPYVPVSLGQTPIVFDPFMLPRVGEQQPSAVADLVARIEAGDFDLVVLVEPLQPVDRAWWNEEDFGAPIARAIADAYRYSGRTQGYYLYVPKNTDGQT
jgi:hypothetical protein